MKRYRTNRGELQSPFVHGDTRVFEILSSVDDVIPVILDTVPIESRFREALTLSLVNRRLADITRVLLQRYYKIWLTPLVQMIEVGVADEALSLMRRLVVPMYGFSTPDYVAHIEDSLSCHKLATLHTRLCHLTTCCNEVCTDNNGIGYRYHIGDRIINTCAPRIRTHCSLTKHQLFMDLIHVLIFTSKEVLVSLPRIRHLKHGIMGAALNELYLYHKRDVADEEDEGEEKNLFVHEIEYDKDETLVDIRRMTPLYDAAACRFSVDINSDDIMVLRIIYPSCIPHYGTSLSANGTQLLSAFIESTTAMNNFRRAMMLPLHQ